jgi:hypothetical protein
VSPASPSDRVRALFAGARRTFRPRAADELVHRLALETGLSLEGVRHALGVILELDVDDVAIDAFVERARGAGDAPAIAVVLSANVFTAPFRAIAWALARSSRVVVRPSRRGQLFPTVLAGATRGLFELAPASDDPASDVARVCDRLPKGAALHVYGGAAALATARSATQPRPDLQLELHGPGFGVVIAHAGDLTKHAELIALDVAAFDQRGCLSPRLVLSIGDRAASALAANALHEALGRVGERLPRGTASAHELGAASLARETAAFQGRALEGPHHLVLDLGDAPDAPVGPAFRTVPVSSVPHVDDAMKRLVHVASGLTVVGSVEGTLDPDALQAIAPAARIVTLGAMQRPPFSIGPVDARPRTK